ncbi:RHS repeat-associated core domain-containing protein, partial [Chloroflexota bacterium]
MDSFPTDKLFTGQRLDGTGLYYYNARYYDPEIGRFISPDTIIPNPANPQSFNRYSYVLNNPLRYTDPTGHWPSREDVMNTGKKVLGALEVAKDKVIETYENIQRAAMQTVGVTEIDSY